MAKRHRLKRERRKWLTGPAKTSRGKSVGVNELCAVAAELGIKMKPKQLLSYVANEDEITSMVRGGRLPRGMQ